MTMKKSNPGCCTCGGAPSCTCTTRTCWVPYAGDMDSDVPHPLRCKCLFPDGCPDDLPDITLDIAGSGTPLNDDIPCSTVACDWDGTFVLACNNGGLDYVEFVKYTYICDDFAPAPAKFYYKHVLRCNYSSAGVFVKTVGNRATFNLTVTMISQVWYYPIVSGATFPDGTWGSVGGPGAGTAYSTISQVVHLFSADSFLEFQRSDIDETNCPTDPCNPYGELVECGTLMTGSVTTDTAGQGCYPDPDDVTVTPSWPP